MYEKGPRWSDLKIGKYVEYLMHVSSEYFTSSVLPCLTSTDGRASCVVFACVMPWINNAQGSH